MEYVPAIHMHPRVGLLPGEVGRPKLDGEALVWSSQNEEYPEGESPKAFEGPAGAPFFTTAIDIVRL